MKIRIISLVAAAGLALGATGLAAPASAQVEQLAIAPDKDWKHQWTPMEFPATLDSFQRTGVTQFEDRQTNVAGSYVDQDSETILTLYIYRPALPDASIWFDRALQAIGAGDVLGNANLANMKFAGFVPAGGIAESGQYAAIKVSGNFRSTGVAIYRAGEWLVKVRISSRKLKVPTLEQTMLGVLADLQPLPEISQSPAYIVEPCSDEIVFNGADAVPADKAKGMTMGLALSVSSIAASIDGGGGPASVRFCREGKREQRVNLYRPDGSTMDYVLALGDSGFSVDVSPQRALEGLISPDSTGTLTYQVRSASGLDTTIHTAFTGMPTPDQALEAVFERDPIATINRVLGDEETTVSLQAD